MSATERFDYEGELAVVIGRGGRAIARDRALEHVAGYAAFNDASVRDWQRHTSQFTPGKNFPASGGFGPALVTRDEIAKNDFNISPSRYIQTGAAEEYRLIAEIVEELEAIEDDSRHGVDSQNSGSPLSSSTQQQPELR